MVGVAVAGVVVMGIVFVCCVCYALCVCVLLCAMCVVYVVLCGFVFVVCVAVLCLRCFVLLCFWCDVVCCDVFCLLCCAGVSCRCVLCGVVFWFRTDRPGLQERPSAPLVPWRCRGEPALPEVVVDQLVVGKEGGLELEWWGRGQLTAGRRYG